jgi:hypothetical protein
VSAFLIPHLCFSILKGPSGKNGNDDANIFNKFSSIRQSYLRNLNLK